MYGRTIEYIEKNKKKKTSYKLWTHPVEWHIEKWLLFQTNGCECYSSVELIALEHRDAVILKCDSQNEKEKNNITDKNTTRKTQRELLFFLMFILSCSYARYNVSEVELHRFGCIYFFVTSYFFVCCTSLYSHSLALNRKLIFHESHVWASSYLVRFIIINYSQGHTPKWW